MRGLTIVAAVITLLCITLSQADADTRVVPFNSPLAPEIKTLADVPLHVAKEMPDEAWFWWAKAHNEREYQKAAASRGTRVLGYSTQVDTNYKATNPGGNYFYQNRGTSRATIGQRSFTQSYERRTGGLPAVIYNPFCRAKK